MANPDDDLDSELMRCIHDLEKIEHQYDDPRQ
jgi:hypothetical protein